MLVALARLPYLHPGSFEFALGLCCEIATGLRPLVFMVSIPSDYKYSMATTPAWHWSTVQGWWWSEGLGVEVGCSFPGIELPVAQGSRGLPVPVLAECHMQDPALCLLAPRRCSVDFHPCQQAADMDHHTEETKTSREGPPESPLSPASACLFPSVFKPRAFSPRPLKQLLKWFHCIPASHNLFSSLQSA